MRGTSARSTTTPGPGGDPPPACPPTDIPKPRRRQGRTALGGLPSTSEFTNSRLSPDDRKLILFLLVHLADDDDALTGTYQRLLETYGTRADHWCANKDVTTLRRAVSKFLGKGAETTPSWDRIVDMLEAVLPPPQRERALPHAAALFSRAHRRAKPTRDYTGPVIAPSWADEPTVTVEMIRADLVEPAPAPALASITAPVPAAPAPDEGAASSARSALARAHPSDDPESLREVLWTVVGEFRQQCYELDHVRAQRDQAREQLQEQRAQNWHLQADNRRVGRVAEQLLREQHPTVSPETIRLLLEDRIDSAFSPRPPKPRSLHG
jgi:hypothetical protein